MFKGERGKQGDHGQDGQDGHTGLTGRAGKDAVAVFTWKQALALLVCIIVFVAVVLAISLRNLGHISEMCKQTNANTTAIEGKQAQLLDC